MEGRRAGACILDRMPDRTEISCPWPVSQCDGTNDSGGSQNHHYVNGWPSPRVISALSGTCRPVLHAPSSLGLSKTKAMRFVVLPQAVRRVVPPLLNDFIGLQKDTALVALIGPVEAFRQSQIEVAANFDYTPYFATALLFVALTIPMARFTDWLVARERRRRR